MTIVLIHHNYPGQFRFILKHLAALGHDIYFICDTNYHQNSSFNNVRVITTSSSNNTLPGLRKNELMSYAYRNSLETLKESSIYPDIIFSHSGFGCGFFVKDVFPKAFLVSYAEWYFTDHFYDYYRSLSCPWLSSFFTESVITQNTIRNHHSTHEILSADLVITPTHVQAQQFPSYIRDKLFVNHEGIDVDFYTPSLPKNPASNVIHISYATRGMEPIRGFPHFIKAAIRICLQHQNIIVHIAGSDRVAYGSRLPPEGSFGVWAKNLLKSHNLLDRFVFHGQLNLSNYKQLLHQSTIHCYFTHLFIPSWSLIEAMACNCTILTNLNPSTAEFLDSYPNTVSSIHHNLIYDKLNYMISNQSSHSHSKLLFARASRYEYKNSLRTLFSRIPILG